MRAAQYALLNHLKKAQNGFIPEITRVLALPFQDFKHGANLGPDLPFCRVLDREKLKSPYLSLRHAVANGQNWEAWKKQHDAAKHRVSREQMHELLRALTPRVVPPPTLSEILREEGQVQDECSQAILDHLAFNFSRGRFHVQGAPGSGKSMLARQVARIWAAEGRHVLMLAYNRAYTYATQCALDDLQRNDQCLVSTYHDFAVNLLRDARQLPEFLEANDFFSVQVPKALARLIQTPMELAKWDALVIDEAQDLESEWISPLLNLLRHPDDPVLILEDPAQCIYREPLHVIGQPWRLELNLRQHAVLREAACRTLPDCPWNQIAAKPCQADKGIIQIKKTSSKTWRQDLAQQLDALCKECIQPSQVMILAPHRPSHIGVEDAERLGPWRVNTVPDWWEDEKADHVRLGTVHGFKGLEADIVIYLAPDHPTPEKERLAYVAYSRARHRLIVLENAISEPGRKEDAKKVSSQSSPEETTTSKAIPPPPKAPFKPAVLSEEQSGLLMASLKAAKKGPEAARRNLK